MSVEISEQHEADGHQHKDVSGGWLRPAVFGAMDGLVTNVSLIAGVGAGVNASGGSPHLIVLTGLAGLAAGAFSMATGEYVSVSSQNELVEAEVRKEQHELEHNAESERRELAETFRRQGVEPELADKVAAQISANPEHALDVHVREELGVDHRELPSPYTAAGASLVTFAIGALIPLLPYLFRVRQPGPGPGPGRGGRVRRRRPGGPAHRPAVPPRRGAPAGAGRGGGRHHVRDRQRRRRRRLLPGSPHRATGQPSLTRSRRRTRRPRARPGWRTAA